jgi:hypothetical protein
MTAVPSILSRRIGAAECLVCESLDDASRDRTVGGNRQVNEVEERAAVLWPLLTFRADMTNLMPSCMWSSNAKPRAQQTSLTRWRCSLRRNSDS